MKSLYTETDLINSKSNDLLPLECYVCNCIFYKPKYEIKHVLKHSKINNLKFCSKKCKATITGRTWVRSHRLVFCLQCNKEFKKINSQIIKSKNHFCSRSCSAIYRNLHKSHGNRRSKLEIWLETQLTNIYPKLEFQFNKKLIISSELDIYIPSLNLAFELNGIFHYEPIFGVDKLTQIQENDKSKTKACLDNGIDLCVIDTSQLKYFKPKNGEKYLNIILNIINERILLNS